MQILKDYHYRCVEFVYTYMSFMAGNNRCKRCIRIIVISSLTWNLFCDSMSPKGYMVESIDILDNCLLLVSSCFFRLPLDVK